MKLHAKPCQGAATTWLLRYPTLQLHLGRVLAILTLASLVACGSPMLAQTADTASIENFRETLSLRPMLIYTHNSLSFSESRFSDTEVDYIANAPLAMGLRLGWHSYGISYSFNIPGTQFVPNAPSKMFDFQYHHNGRWLLADLYLLAYRGYYTRDSARRVTFHPNVSFLRIGGRASYPIQGDNLSYSAIFDQGESQRVTAFCFPVGLGFYYQRLFLPKEREIIKLNERYTLEIFVGMTGVVPFRKHYFAAAEASIGFSHPVNFNHAVAFSPTLTTAARLSIGYTVRLWSLALVIYSHTMDFAPAPKQYISLRSGTVEIACTLRLFAMPKALRWLEYGQGQRLPTSAE